MKKLIIHPTETSQWYAIINEAQAITNHIINEQMESYLVFLLMRFSQSVHLLDSILAIDFLTSFQLPKNQQIVKLKEIGDKSLLFCGLFPEMATRRQLSLAYFLDLGQAAYLGVSARQTPPEDNLFSELSEQFQLLTTILQAMREGNTVMPPASRLLLQ